jgi:hypothetical protein
MKKESRNQILAAYDDAFRVLGFKDYSAAFRFVCREMEARLRTMKSVRSRYDMDARLAKQSEPSPAGLIALLESIRHIPFVVRKTLPQAAKELPHDPGGRDKAVKPGKYPKICRKIGLLLSEGVSLKDAQLRAAQENRVSTRTIERIWQQRRSMASARSEKKMS